MAYWCKSLYSHIYKSSFSSPSVRFCNTMNKKNNPRHKCLKETKYTWLSSIWPQSLYCNHRQSNNCSNLLQDQITRHLHLHHRGEHVQLYCYSSLWHTYRDQYMKQCSAISTGVGIAAFVLRATSRTVGKLHDTIWCWWKGHPIDEKVAIFHLPSMVRR